MISNLWLLETPLNRVGSYWLVIDNKLLVLAYRFKWSVALWSAGKLHNILFLDMESCINTELLNLPLVLWSSMVGQVLGKCLNHVAQSGNMPCSDPASGNLQLGWGPPNGHYMWHFLFLLQTIFHTYWSKVSPTYNPLAPIIMRLNGMDELSLDSW